MYLLIEDYELLEKYKTVWDKIADIKSNLITSISTIKVFLKTKVKSFWKKLFRLLNY